MLCKCYVHLFKNSIIKGLFSCSYEIDNGCSDFL